MTSTGLDNLAWERAKAEIIARYPYDTNFGYTWTSALLSMVAQRAQQIKLELQGGTK